MFCLFFVCSCASSSRGDQGREPQTFQKGRLKEVDGDLRLKKLTFDSQQKVKGAWARGHVKVDTLGNDPRGRRNLKADES